MELGLEFVVTCPFTVWQLTLMDMGELPNDFQVRPDEDD
jgi:hypothetical protein